MVMPTRHTLQFACLLTVAIPIGLLAAREASAQAMLDQLEDRLREEMAEAQEKPAPVQPAAAAREPGYVGIVADDKNDRGRGVRILEVKPGSPAEKAGLKAGDLIVGLAEMRLRQMSDMALILQQVRPGGSVAVEVLRGDQKIRVVVNATQRAVVAAQPPEPAPPPPAVIPAPPVAVPAVVAKPVPDGAAANPQAKIEQLERRVEALEQRVAELEALLRQAK